MAELSSKILEGVFAIKKPPSVSSAQVLRDLQNKFKTSSIFHPLLKETERRENESGQSRSKRRRISSDNVFKMGHGGTLDPLATGVLIVGIGRGTKHLINFLECTKTYDTVVLFGKSTDTYDIAGKIVAEASAKHITKEIVEEKLCQFRGKIEQVPPIYSALKINGMKAYEYARTGKELPRELETREMNVEECELLEWLEPGQHDYRWPVAEAAAEDKAAARKLMKGAARTEGMDENAPAETEATEGQAQPKSDRTNVLHSKEEDNALPPSEKAALHTHDIPTLSDVPADVPIARVRLTVSSGFYVRSFAHDLGIACSSFGIMAELARTRQSDYTSIEPAPADLIPCLTYEELEMGEGVWGPKIAGILATWMEKNPPPRNDGMNDRDRSRQQWRPRGRGGYGNEGSGHRSGKRSWSERHIQVAQRRNSSSPE